MDDVVVTNREIYEKCQEILSAVKELNGREIELLNSIASTVTDVNSKLDSTLSELEKVYNGLKTISDNQVVIDDKLKSIIDSLNEVRRLVSNLQVLLPGE